LEKEEEKQQELKEVTLMKKDSQFKADVVEEENQESIFHTFENAEGNVELKEDEWYFMQLPMMLNMALTVKRSDSHSLRNIPSGNIGKLRLHKSGKVTMVLSPPGNQNNQANIKSSSSSKEVVYNLNHGVKQTFFNEMAHLSDQNLVFLPKLKNKIVVTPDIQSML
jgi:hypothetical protein